MATTDHTIKYVRISFVGPNRKTIAHTNENPNNFDICIPNDTSSYSKILHNVIIKEGTDKNKISKLTLKEWICTMRSKEHFIIDNKNKVVTKNNYVVYGHLTLENDGKYYEVSVFSHEGIVLKIPTDIEFIYNVLNIIKYTNYIDQIIHEYDIDHLRE